MKNNLIQICNTIKACKIQIGYSAIWAIICMLSTLNIGYAQQSKYRHYKTMDYMKEIKNLNPEAKDNAAKFEREKTKFKRLHNHKDIIIPIVFHVLYQNANQQISESLIAEQINILNDDFAGFTQDKFITENNEEDRRKLGQYKSKKADTRIQFCLPRKDPNNKKTTGVNYISTETEIWADYYSIKTEGSGMHPWNPSEYLNVWVGNLEEGNAGFAQMPGGPDAYDGIVIDYEYIQDINVPESPYDGGHTLTHLVGNFLGLYPLWGESRCEDDYVSDTPIHNAPHFSCKNNRHLSSCGSHPIEMINNFMDNTNDDCLEMFTPGQMVRMQTFLSPDGLRAGLASHNTKCVKEDNLEEFHVEQLMIESLNNGVKKLDVRLIPNPVSTLLSVKISNTNNEHLRSRIQVRSITGKVKLTQNISDSFFELDVHDYSSGAYYLLVENSKGFAVVKFIVQ